MSPVCAIYSTFLQRAYDQINHDCSLQNLHVVFCLDRAGLVGQDGPTHHGVLDMIYLRSIPGMVLMAPKDEQELRDMLHSAIYDFTKGPVAIRYPRGKAVGVSQTEMKSIPLGKAEILVEGSGLAILAVGKMVSETMKALPQLHGAGIYPELINARFIKPLDYEMLDDICSRFDKILTIEEGQVNGGFGSAVLEYVGTKYNRETDVKIHGIPDRYIEHGTQEELLHSLRLDADGIASVVKKFLNIPIEEEYELLEKA
jgi:1-deoxy-D-xylulose-5-phosphate synthase